MSGENEDFNLDSNTQAEFLKNFQSRMISMVSGENADAINDMDPLLVIDDLVDSLRASGESEDMLEILIALKEDADIATLLTRFESALNGDTDALFIPDAPLYDSKTPSPSDILHDVNLSEIDSIEAYSDYISGSGTTLGGFFSGFPGDLASAASDSYKLSKRGLYNEIDKLKKIIESNDVLENRWRFNESLDMKAGHDWAESIKQARAHPTHFGLVKNLPNTPLTAAELRRKTIELDSQLQRAEADLDARSRASHILNKVGIGVKVAGAGFSAVQGGFDLAGGADKIEDLNNRLANGEITQSEYNQLRHQANLRLAGGATGIASGMASISELVIDKVADAIPASKSAAKAARFAPIAGGIIAITAGVLSVTKNAIAADDARRTGNHGRAAMFGVMAALDSVTLVLDAVSTVLDFIPGIGTAVSFVVDLVSTVIGFVSDLIGFFTELVDTRTDVDKVDQAFEDYTSSDQFKDYLNSMADNFKEQGYDVFEYYTDAESAGIEDGDAELRRNKKYSDVRDLTDFVEGQVEALRRRAIIDNQGSAAELEGGEGDDLIKVIAQNTVGLKTLIGRGGDDILVGAPNGPNVIDAGEGDDEAYGGDDDDQIDLGDGDDSASAGGGDDVIDAGPGNDYVEPGAGDDVVDLGPGNDIIKGLLGSNVIDGNDGVDTLIADSFFNELPYSAVTVDWKNVDSANIPDQVADRYNYGSYSTEHNPAIGFSVDLELGTAIGHPNAQAITHFAGGIYNDEFKSREHSWWSFKEQSNPAYHEYVDRVRYSRLKLVDESLSTISIGSVLSNSNVSSYFTPTLGTQGWSTYLRGAADSNIKSGHDRFLSSALSEGREIHYIGSATVFINSDTAYPGMSIFTDGEQIMVYDQLAGYAVIDRDTLVAMSGGNEQSAIGFLLYTMDKLTNTQDISSIENAMGSEFNDVLKGSSGNNKLIAADGDDELYGRAGNDWLVGSGQGSNVLDGGDGIDTASYLDHSQGVFVDLESQTVVKEAASEPQRDTDRLVDIESLVATEYADDVTGSSGNDRILTHGGNDVVNAGAGDDVVDGGAGADILSGGEGIDTLSYSSRSDDIQVNLKTHENSDGDTLSGFENIIAGQGDDVITGDDNDNLLIASQGTDRLNGGQGDDVLMTYSGTHHTLSGGEGMDVYVISGDSDNVNINEYDDYNIIVLKSISELSDMTLELDSTGNFVIKNQEGDLLVTDLVSGGLLRLGETSLRSLANDFVLRFPIIQLSNDVTISGSTLLEWVNEQLFIYEEQGFTLSGDPISSVDMTVRSDAESITTGQGNDIVRASAEAETDSHTLSDKVINTQQGDDLINVSGGRAQTVSLTPGIGNDTVVVDDQQNIDLYLGDQVEGNQDTLVFKFDDSMVISAVRNAQNDFIMTLASGKTVRFDQGALPSILLFETGDKTWMVEGQYDVERYMTSLISGNERIKVRHYIDNEGNSGFDFSDLTSESIRFSLSQNRHGTQINLMDQDNTLFSFDMPDIQSMAVSKKGMLTALMLNGPKTLLFSDTTLTENSLHDWYEQFALNAHLRDEYAFDKVFKGSVHSNAVSGASSDDVIVGNVMHYNPLLDAGAGDDVIFTRPSGLDELPLVQQRGIYASGGAGDDVIVVGADVDSAVSSQGGAGQDTLVVDDYLLSELSIDILTTPDGTQRYMTIQSGEDYITSAFDDIEQVYFSKDDVLLSFSDMEAYVETIKGDRTFDLTPYHPDSSLKQDVVNRLVSAIAAFEGTGGTGDLTTSSRVANAVAANIVPISDPLK
ncbi:hypothetical protein ACH42_09145 [Endozoicomonas sp. (ex Bugula neritina AB1)]|nr:hypothetical protein ACH42_09145 [Endozoicomonas sp. (ex Bugula neritina AB1)]